jgi:hypothetical protein
MDINSQHQNLFGNQISPKSGGFLYFGGHFGFKMATIQHPHLVERDKPKKSESVGQTLPQLPWKKFKMVAVAMVTKVQNVCQIQKSSDLDEIWFPCRL